MKKQDGEFTSSNSLSKKIFGERFKVFDKFVDKSDKFIKLFSLLLLLLLLFSL